MSWGKRGRGNGSIPRAGVKRSKDGCRTCPGLMCLYWVVYARGSQDSSQTQRTICKSCSQVDNGSTTYSDIRKWWNMSGCLRTLFVGPIGCIAMSVTTR